MIAGIVDIYTKTLIAKSVYELFRSNKSGDVFYAGVGFPSRNDYISYSGDSEDASEFKGGSKTGFDSDLSDLYFYSQHLVTLHKIYSGGVSRVVPRSDWMAGSIYNSWPARNSHQIVKQFRGGVASLNVYRCLFSPGTSSTIAPNNTSSDPSLLSDGYVWKFLYSITNSEAIRFLTEDWMPVPESVTQEELATLTPGSVRYTQMIIQNNTVAGTVYDIEGNLSAGEYVVKDLSSVPQQECRISVSSGGVKTLVMHGIGYTGPCQVLKDGNVEASVKAFIAPGAGHGSDIAEEMFASNVSISLRNIPDGGILDFMNNTTYNMISLIKNPLDKATGKKCTRDFYVACKSYESNSTTTRDVTPVATIGNRKYYVARDNKEELSSTVLTTDANVSAVYDREIVFASGQTLMVDWKADTVTRSIDQIETLTFIIGFNQ